MRSPASELLATLGILGLCSSGRALYPWMLQVTAMLRRRLGHKIPGLGFGV